jgi:hypothetical protein
MKNKGMCWINTSIPEEKGISQENHEILVDVFVVNLKDVSDHDIEKLFGNVNSIWEIYGIQFYNNNAPKRINDKSLSLDFNNINNDTEVIEFGKKVIGTHFYRIDDTIIDVIIVRNLHRRFNSDVCGGRALINGSSHNFIVISLCENNHSWYMAHEFAHILGPLDRPYFMGELNFMTHFGCIQEEYPTNLNQNQIDKVIRNARNFQHNTL